MKELFQLSVDGSIAVLVVLALDWAFRNSMSTKWRRIWWVLLPIAFLVHVPLRLLPPIKLFSTETNSSTNAVTISLPATHEATASLSRDEIFVICWAIGAAVYLILVAVRTLQTSRFWAHQRLCTRTPLLEMLEDCKMEIGVVTPIGLVLSDEIQAPAILGWLRPRILLPSLLTEQMTGPELRAVMLHELGHFRSGDLLWSWLFTLACAIHWYNPFVHWAHHAWRQFIEESADETVLTLLNDSSELAYGKVLLKAIRHANSRPPCGALAIGESIHQLKHRIIMITHCRNRSNRPIVALFCALPLLLGFILPISHAQTNNSVTVTDPKEAAVTAIKAWLELIDQGHYAQSWDEADGPEFKKALTQAQWVQALNQARKPLGKVKSRVLASAALQIASCKDAPSSVIKLSSDVVTAQFNTSFENMASSLETVLFVKTPDGSWKAVGYTVKPN